MSGERDPEEAAHKLGLICVYPEADELFVDLDRPEDFDRFMEHLAILDDIHVVLWWLWRPSKSGGGRKHVVVKLRDEIDQPRRLMLQAMLCSDAKRELLGLRQDGRGFPRSTCFFEAEGFQEKNSQRLDVNGGPIDDDW